MIPEAYAADGKQPAAADATAAKPDATPAQPSNPQAASVAPTTQETWLQRFGNWIASQAGPGFEWPSWSRGLITFGVLCLMGVGIAMAGGALATLLSTAAMTMGAGAFSAWLLSLVVWAFVIYFGGKLIVKTAQYFFTKAIDRDIAYVRDSVAHAVTPSPKYTVDANGVLYRRETAPLRAA